MSDTGISDALERVVRGLRLSVGIIDLCPHSTTVRVLRCEKSGVTLYAHADPPTTSGCNARPLYLLAYEGEVEPATEIREVIVRTDEPHEIYAAFALLERHVERIIDAVSADLRKPAPHAEAIRSAHRALDLAELGGLNFFDQASVRRELAAVSPSAPTTDEALSGFRHAVLSRVDHWLNQTIGSLPPSSAIR